MQAYIVDFYHLEHCQGMEYGKRWKGEQKMVQPSPEKKNKVFSEKPHSQFSVLPIIKIILIHCFIDAYLKTIHRASWYASISPLLLFYAD